MGQEHLHLHGSGRGTALDARHRGRVGEHSTVAVTNNGVVALHTWPHPVDDAPLGADDLRTVDPLQRIVDRVVRQPANTGCLVPKADTERNHLRVRVWHRGVGMTENEASKEGVPQFHVPHWNLQGIRYLVYRTIAGSPQHRPLGVQVELTAKISHQLAHGGVGVRRPLE